MNKILFTLTIFCVTTAHSKPARVTTKDGLHSAELSEKVVACSGNFLRTLVENDSAETPTISLDVIETSEELDFFAHHLNQLAAIQDAYPKATDDELRKQLAPSLQKLPLPAFAGLVKHTDFYGVRYSLPVLEQELLERINQERVPLAAQLAANNNPSWLATLPERVADKALAQEVMQRHPLLFFAVEKIRGGVSFTNFHLLLSRIDRVSRAQVNPEGSKKVVGRLACDACVSQKNAQGEGEVVMLRGHTRLICTAKFSLDSSKIVTASEDNTARVWQQNAQGEWGTVAELRGHTDELTSAQFSPDGRKVVTTSDDNTARVWAQNEDGQWVFVAILQGHTDGVKSAQFSPDGSKIVTGSKDNTARVWQKNERNEWVSVAVLEGHDCWVTSAQFSPDSTKIVTASLDRRARVWQQNVAGEWEPVAVLRGHGDWVKGAYFRADGTKIITMASSSVIAWNVLDVIGSNKKAGLVLTLADALPALQRLEQCGDDAAQKESIVRALIEKINPRKNKTSH